MAGNDRVRIAEMETEALEEHDRDVNPTLACFEDALVQPIEVGLVELEEVEPASAVVGETRTPSGPRVWSDTIGTPGVEVRSKLEPDVLPPPKPDEIHLVRLQEVQVRPKVKGRRRSIARSGPHAILEVVP
jgi:hypothetical protein